MLRFVLSNCIHLVLLTLVLNKHSLASQFIDLGIDEQLSSSTSFVLGKIIRKKCGKLNNVIHTFYDYEVVQEVKGKKVPSILTLAVPGGEFEGKGLHVSASPQFSVNKYYGIITEKLENYYSVKNYKLGAFEIERTSGQFKLKNMAFPSSQQLFLKDYSTKRVRKEKKLVVLKQRTPSSMKNLNETLSFRWIYFSIILSFFLFIFLMRFFKRDKK